MKRVVVSLTIGLLMLAGSASADEDEFLFGIWTYDLPHIADVDSLFTELTETLHFNTVVGQCYTDFYRQKYSDHDLNVIVGNGSLGPKTAGVGTAPIPYWISIYGSSAYSEWQSEGSGLGPCELCYNGGEVVTGDSGTAVFFDASEYQGELPTVIQYGPHTCCSDDEIFGQQWQYWSSFLLEFTPYRYNLLRRQESLPDGIDPLPTKLPSVPSTQARLRRAFRCAPSESRGRRGT